ncbi:type I secretion system permease/ATPase [Niveibacterium umoris]|uniref:PrtD family type I secretion system ABC transporter n=1 Tax=Niveibacterium umoris TaxID=1193620 RepID=A0A840BNN2_9RHOO|nr:type I secretion system permease/ATPase [Niveibacterium umoris]MBB4014590.1 PrtD family type I secretion system ABC transporter [Niveibacterium umoris]
MKGFVWEYRRVILQAFLASLLLNLLLLSPAIYMMQVFDRVFSSQSTDTLAWLTLIVVVTLLFYFAVEWFRGRMLTAFALVLDEELGERVLRLVMEDAAQPGFHRHAYLMRDVASLRRFVSGAGFTGLMDVPWLPLLLLLIFVFHPVLGALATCSTAVLVGLSLLNNRLAKRPFVGLTEASREASAYVDISMRNAEAVRAMGMFPALAVRWSAINRGALDHQYASGRIVALFGGLGRFARQFIQVGMVGVGAWLVVAEHATPGIMMATTLILGRALTPVEHLIAGWKDIIDAIQAYRRLDEAFSAPRPASAVTTLPPLAGRLEVERVVFAVAPGQLPLIKSVSIQLEPGEFLGVIGPSGSGKSSLLRLLTGVWRPQSGAIRYDGAELSQWTPEALGAQIGYVPQDVELFPGTVAENIARMTVPDSDDVIRAAMLAGAHDMILRLQKGYDTEIGVGGAALSGGQRQRVALARALYRNPAVVILDEPDANLDAEGELALRNALSQLQAAGKTLVVVSHRRNLLDRAARLLVMRDGAAALYGPRELVLEKLGVSGEVAHG